MVSELTLSHIYNNLVSRIDPNRLDTPGCDGLPAKYESPCALEACARHDECFCKNNCSSSSWLDLLEPCINPCKKCDTDVLADLIACGLWDTGEDDPNSPNYYCGQCGVFFDLEDPNDINDPQKNPHFGHSSGRGNNGCNKKGGKK